MRYAAASCVRVLLLLISYLLMRSVTSWERVHAVVGTPCLAINCAKAVPKAPEPNTHAFCTSCSFALASIVAAEKVRLSLHNINPTSNNTEHKYREFQLESLAFLIWGRVDTQPEHAPHTAVWRKVATSKHAQCASTSA